MVRFIYFAFLQGIDTDPEVTAHQQAVNRCKTIHRDISSGNILILPVFVQETGEMSLRIKWRGILTDWELCKPVAESLGEEKARQPERTVSMNSG